MILHYVYDMFSNQFSPQCGEKSLCREESQQDKENVVVVVLSSSLILIPI